MVPTRVWTSVELAMKGITVVSAHGATTRRRRVINVAVVKGKLAIHHRKL